jgi:hypothetical protein
MKNNDVPQAAADHAAAQSSAARSPKSRRRAPCPQPGSRQANKLAVIVLDVLAGVRLPAQAAQEAGISQQSYYHLEQRVLDAIVRACEPRPRGKVRSPQRQIEELQRQIGRLEQECARQQALVRAAHRTIGLSAPVTKPAAKSAAKPTNSKSDGGKRKRSRRPTVRALKAAQMLRAAEASPTESDEAAVASTTTDANEKTPPVAERVIS